MPISRLRNAKTYIGSGKIFEATEMRKSVRKPDDTKGIREKVVLALLQTKTTGNSAANRCPNHEFISTSGLENLEQNVAKEIVYFDAMQVIYERNMHDRTMSILRSDGKSADVLAQSLKFVQRVRDIVLKRSSGAASAGWT